MKNKKWKAVLALSLAVAVFTGVAGVSFAAGADANVKGLWLRAPAFPEDAEVLLFVDNQDMDIVTYTRMVDGMITLEIRRQPIEGSELQEPGDARGLIEMRVYNSGGDEGEMDIDTDAADVSEHFTYPCATATYKTGQNEDTRFNASIFIFTDVYCFEVMISAAADWWDDYSESAGEWIESLEFVEGGNAGGRSGGVMSDEDFAELCGDGTYEEIDRAIEAGANVNARDEYGVTPLMRAARDNSVEVLSLLLGAGANIDDKDEDGDTPLHWAAIGDKAEAIVFLLDSGADADAVNNNGNKANFWLSSSKPDEVDEALWSEAVERLK